MSVRCSVPDVLLSTPGVMHIYSWCCTCITLGVMQGWELPVPWYQVLECCVTYDMYVIYMSYASLSCMSCYSFPANYHTYTPPASCSKLICIVSVGSSVASVTQSLLTGAQLQPSCSWRSVLSLMSFPDCCGCCGLRWPLLGDPYYLI